MSENDDMKQNIPTPRGAGRTTANEMQLTAILSNVFRPDELDAIREDYWRTIRELRGEEE